MEEQREGSPCRFFFPLLEKRLKMKLHITPEVKAVVTENGKISSNCKDLNNRQSYVSMYEW
jgi:hypothetical protein